MRIPEYTGLDFQYTIYELWITKIPAQVYPFLAKNIYLQHERLVYGRDEPDERDAAVGTAAERGTTIRDARLRAGLSLASWAWTY